MSYTGLARMVASSLLLLALALAETAGSAQTPLIVGPPPGVTFSGLSGPNLGPYTGDTEGSFTVTPTAGSWLQATFYGNLGPSIADGPLNAPGIGVLLITDSAGPFTLSAFDFSSNNGDSSYDIQGYLGATLQYHETGSLPGTFGPYGFTTMFTANPSVPVDGLLLALIPGADATSINLDNLGVVTVPEPGMAAFVGLSLAGWGWFGRTGSSRRQP